MTSSDVVYRSLLNQFCSVKLHIITLMQRIIGLHTLHHQQIIFASIYHVHFGLIMRLDIDIVLLSKDFCNKRWRFEALACWWHHKWARVVTGDSLVLLKGRERMMIQVNHWWWGQLEWLMWRVIRVGSVAIRPWTAVVVVIIIAVAAVLIATRSWASAVNIMKLSHMFLQIEVSTESLWDKNMIIFDTFLSWGSLTFAQILHWNGFLSLCVCMWNVKL